MKKIIGVLSVLFLVVGVYAAPSVHEIVSDIEYGFDAGVNISTMQGLSGHSTAVGGLLGGTATYQFSPSGHLDTFLGLLQRGSDADGDALRLNYLYLPVTLRYNVQPMGPKKTYVYTGLYGAVLLSATLDGNTIDDDVQDLDFGWTYGVGMHLPLHNKELSLSIGYEMGLRGTYTVSGDWGYNRSLVIKGGLRF